MQNFVIFIIDDDDDPASYLKTKLCKKIEGISVEIFSDTKKARQALEGKDLHPSWYVCDINIPDDQDGAKDLYYFLKERGESSSLVYWSGHESEYDRRLCEETDVKLFLKDMDGISGLVEMIKAHLSNDSKQP